MTDRTTPQEASRAAFEAKYARIPAITSTKETAWLCWQAATQARDAECAALRDALAQVLSDLEIGAHPHLHIDQIRAVLRDPQQ